MLFDFGAIFTLSMIGALSVEMIDGKKINFGKIFGYAFFGSFAYFAVSAYIGAVLPMQVAIFGAYLFGFSGAKLQTLFRDGGLFRWFARLINRELGSMLDNEEKKEKKREK